MQLTSTTAQHSMEHAMSAYHHNLPHGAGLIMISVEFARYFIERHACDEQFIKMARVMGMPNADKPEDFITALHTAPKGLRRGRSEDERLRDHQQDECMTLAVNARETMGGLFLANPCPMSDEECAGIFEKAYRQAKRTRPPEYAAGVFKGAAPSWKRLYFYESKGDELQ